MMGDACTRACAERAFGRVILGSFIWAHLPARLLNRTENFVRFEAIMRPQAGMVNAHDAIGIYQHVAAKLPPVFSGFAGTVPLKEQRQKFPQRSRTEHLPPRCTSQTIRRIQPEIRIKQQRPRQFRLSRVGRGKQVVVKRDHVDPNSQSVQFCLSLPQLRHVRPAWRSSKMPMKHQQQPSAVIFIQRMHPVGRVAKTEINGALACPIMHHFESSVVSHLKSSKDPAS